MKKQKKIINDPKNVVPEQIEGMIKASHGKLRQLDGITAVVSNSPVSGKVGIVIGGGSGHEPVSAGYIGPGFADGAACGNVFASPTPDIVLETIKAVDTGAGVINLVLNYSGDNLNFDIASEMAEEENIQTRSVRLWDDVASAPPERVDDRRGIAGYIYFIKVVGAACAAGLSLDEVEKLAIKARENIRSIGVAVSSGAIPESGEPTFEIGDDEIEIGMGIHGEPGVERIKMLPADELVTHMVNAILVDMPLLETDKVCLLVNNLGASTLMELFIINRKVHSILKENNIQVHDTLVGSYCTSLEMAGFSISMMKLDDELKTYYDAPAACAVWSKG